MKKLLILTVLIISGLFNSCGTDNGSWVELKDRPISLVGDWVKDDIKRYSDGSFHPSLNILRLTEDTYSRYSGECVEWSGDNTKCMDTVITITNGNYTTKDGVINFNESGDSTICGPVSRSLESGFILSGKVLALKDGTWVNKTGYLIEESIYELHDLYDCN